jgi:5-methylcytosine-specific restriction protein A
VLVHGGGSRCAAHKVTAGSFADKRRGTRHERGYGAVWVRIRERILRRDAGICQPCLRDGHVHQGTEVDHIVPKSQGGGDDDENLQVICKARHRTKTQAETRGAGGGEISTASQVGTVQHAKFFRAQVSRKISGVGDGR